MVDDAKNVSEEQEAEDLKAVDDLLADLETPTVSPPLKTPEVAPKVSAKEDLKSMFDDLDTMLEEELQENENEADQDDSSLLDGIMEGEPQDEEVVAEEVLERATTAEESVLTSELKQNDFAKPPNYIHFDKPQANAQKSTWFEKAGAAVKSMFSDAKQFFKGLAEQVGKALGIDQTKPDTIKFKGNEQTTIDFTRESEASEIEASEVKDPGPKKENEGSKAWNMASQTTAPHSGNGSTHVQEAFSKHDSQRDSQRASSSTATQELEQVEEQMETRSMHK